MSELDPLGRTPISAGMKAQIQSALADIPEGKRGALLVMATESGATAHLAAKIGRDWKIAAGAGVKFDGGSYSGWVAVAGSW